MAARRKGFRIDPPTVADTVHQGLEQAWEGRIAGLEKLEKVRRSKERGLERERQRLSARRTGDPRRMAALESRLELNRTLCGQLKLEVERAKTEPPQREADAWIIHGRVYTHDLQPAPKLSVSIHDSKGKRIESIPPATTGADGYYKLTFRPRKGNKGKKELEAPGAGWGNGARYIRIFNDSRECIHRDDRPLRLIRERVVYKEIQLEEGVLGPTPKGKTTNKAAKED